MVTSDHGGHAHEAVKLLIGVVFHLVKALRLVGVDDELRPF